MSYHRGIAVVIEDDDDVSGLLAQVLAQQGLDVVAVESGPRGVEAVRLNVPLVTTVDLGIPELDGVEVVRKIRTFSSTFIIVITGRNDEADVLQALNAGADAYVTKPFRPRELRARVEAMMRRASPDLLAEAAGRTRVEVPERIERYDVAPEPAPGKALWTADARTPRAAPAPEPDRVRVWANGQRAAGPAWPEPAAASPHSPGASQSEPPRSSPAPTPARPATTRDPAPPEAFRPGAYYPQDPSDEPARNAGRAFEQDYERAYDQAQPPTAGAPLWSTEAPPAPEPPQVPEPSEAFDEPSTPSVPSVPPPGSTPTAPTTPSVPPTPSVPNTTAVPPTTDVPPTTATPEGWEQHQGLRVDRGRELAEVDGRPVDLDHREFTALVALLDSGRRVRSRAELASIILADDGDPSSYLTPAARSTTETVMMSLLAKLGEDPARPRWVEPVPGVGYRRPRT